MSPILDDGDPKENANPWIRFALECNALGANGRALWNTLMSQLQSSQYPQHPLTNKSLRLNTTAALRAKISDLRYLPTTLDGGIDWTNFNFPENFSINGYVFIGDLNLSDSNFSDLDARNAKFTGCVISKRCNFRKSTNFSKSEFWEDCYFTGCNFFDEAWFEHCDFLKMAFFHSSFHREVSFLDSQFRSHANFGGSDFKHDTQFKNVSFEHDANFSDVVFGGPTSFHMTSFRGVTTYVSAKFLGSVSFDGEPGTQLNFARTFFNKAVFAYAPSFFDRKLFEDTRWDGVQWPPRPRSKIEASNAVHCYDRLALIMSDLKRPDDEHLFYRLSTQAKEVRDGWRISSALSRLYGFMFNYGWGMERALGWWMLSIILPALYFKECLRASQGWPVMISDVLLSLAISFSNAQTFLGLNRGPLKESYGKFEDSPGFEAIWGIQAVLGTILLFFLLLTMRNRFRLR